jgi:hypothetical protein
MGYGKNAGAWWTVDETMALSVPIRLAIFYMNLAPGAVTVAYF